MLLGGGAVGAFIGGWMSGVIENATHRPIRDADRPFVGNALHLFFARWGDAGRWARPMTGGIFLSSAGLFLGASIYCESPFEATACAAMAAACAHSQIANWWAVVTAISGRHLGALFGLMNSMGVPGAFFSPIFMGWFADHRDRLGFVGRERWDPAFFIYAGVLIAGGCCWLLINPQRSAVEEEGEEGGSKMEDSEAVESRS
jgi:hypothetical protein